MRPFLLVAMVSWLAIAEAAGAQLPTWTDVTSGPERNSIRSAVCVETTEDFSAGFARRLQAQRMTGGLTFENIATSWRDSLREESRHQFWLWDAAAGWNPWLEGFGCGRGAFGASTRLAGNDDAGDLDDSTGGLSADMDMWLNEAPSLHVLGSYSNTSTKLDDRGDSGQFSFSFQRDADNRYVPKRQITIGSLSRTANAAYAPKKFSLYNETNLNLRNQHVHAQPYQALEYIRLEQDAFTESGADSLDLSVGTDRAAALRSLLGSRVQSHFQTEVGQVTLEGRAAWRHEFLEENQFLDATFSHSGGSSFTILTSNVRRDAAILGPGLTFDLTKSLRFCANYDVLLSGDSTVHAGSGGIESIW